MVRVPRRMTAEQFWYVLGRSIGSRRATVRAGERTSPALRFLDGRVYTVHETTPIPAAVLTEIRDLLKERPPYAGPRIQHTTGFASPEEAAWSAPGADGSASSSITGTTCTGHCDAKA